MSDYWATWIWDFPHLAVGLTEFVLAFSATWFLTNPTPPPPRPVIRLPSDRPIVTGRLGPMYQDRPMVTGEDGRDYRLSPSTVHIPADWRRAMKRKEARYYDSWQLTDD